MTTTVFKGLAKISFINIILLMDFVFLLWVVMTFGGKASLMSSLCREVMNLLVTPEKSILKRPLYYEADEKLDVYYHDKR